MSIVDASIVATALTSIEIYFNDFFEVLGLSQYYKAGGLMERQADWVVLAYLLSYMGWLKIPPTNACTNIYQLSHLSGQDSVIFLAENGYVLNARGCV